ILSINPAIERIFGIASFDVTGRPFLEAIRNNDIAEVITAVLREGEPVSREIFLVLPVRKAFQINAAPIFEGHAINGCLAVIHDITEIKRLETMRRDFVANVSHELKTPLTTIKGFVETLLGGALEDRQNNRNFLKIIQSHAERLHILVNDLLSLSHLESKELVFRLGRNNLRQLADTALTDAQPQWQKKHLTVKNELPSDLFVVADQEKLSQVFSNLIDNAIKFSRENGQLTVSCQDSISQVKVFVEDTGIGIPQKDLSRIFERFYRVDKARSRQLGGTGLGLSIVKHIIEKHQGSVGVESIEDFGSKFWFTLPKA
ncbi:MAG: ATP-binding protein, partial [Candidatus Omnitrophota bacterium]